MEKGEGSPPPPLLSLPYSPLLSHWVSVCSLCTACSLPYSSAKEPVFSQATIRKWQFNIVNISHMYTLCTYFKLHFLFLAICYYFFCKIYLVLFMFVFLKLRSCPVSKFFLVIFIGNFPQCPQNFSVET